MSEQSQISQNPAPPKNTTLTSWKEVAAYLGKGVRTVQRWEQHYALPVRRPAPNSHVIFALPAELDAWVKRQRYFKVHRPKPTIASKGQMRHEQLTKELRTAVARLGMNRQALTSNLVRLQTAIAGIKNSPAVPATSGRI